MGLQLALKVEGILSKARAEGRMGKGIFFKGTDEPVCTIGHASTAVDSRAFGMWHTFFGVPDKDRHAFNDAISTVILINDRHGDHFAEAAELMVSTLKEYSAGD
jgi:hypothetical protein